MVGYRGKGSGWTRRFLAPEPRQVIILHISIKECRREGMGVLVEQAGWL